MSFGILFSVILIIIFLVFGFYVIQKFLGIQEDVQIGKFQENLQSNIDKYWKISSGQSEEYTYNVPIEIKYVCFIDLESSGHGAYDDLYDEIKFYKKTGNNVYFYPEVEGRTNSLDINHVDIESTTETNNPLCLKTRSGEIKLRLEKVQGNTQVIVKT